MQKAINALLELMQRTDNADIRECCNLTIQDLQYFAANPAKRQTIVIDPNLLPAIDPCTWN